MTSKCAKCVALTLGIVLFTVGFPTNTKADSYEDNVGTIAADVFIYRPAGVVLTAAGSALFVLIFPATLISGGTRHTARTLVKTPFNFTFRRPIGTDLHEYVDGY